MTDSIDRQVRVDCDCDEHTGSDNKGLLEKKLLENRIILVADVVSRQLMEKIVARLLYLEAMDPKKQITVYVNSPGGDADSGFAIYDTMKLVSCPVRTVCAGLCASAGIIIFLGSDKGERYSLPNSRFLIHQPSVGAQGQASDLEITAKQILKVRDRYNAIVSEETGIPAKQILKDANRDFWLAAVEALEYKLVDKIIASRSELK